MMSDEQVLQLAANALSRGFDAEAYIVKYIAELKLKENKDLVPGSNVDELIQTLLDLFVKYFNTQDSTVYLTLLDTLRRILSEIYHSTDNIEQKEMFKNFIEQCNRIKQRE